MNIANKLTLFRIILIPIIVLVELFPYSQFNISMNYVAIDTVMLSYKDIAVLVLFTVASITDLLMAILQEVETWSPSLKVFGSDCDKLLVNTLFILLHIVLGFQ